MAAGSDGTAGAGAGERAGGPDPSELTRMRRSDRARDDAWIRAFLAAAPFGVMATVADNLAEPAPVTVSAAVMGRVLPADEALEFSVEYASVVVFGQGRLVEDEDEGYRALQMLLDRYAPHLVPGEDYRPTTPEELKRTAVFRVDIEAWSGKQKAEPPGFPGAFDVPAPEVPFEG